ncbi:DoxX family protein [Myxosarcina sp. GI1]|uniref:DoxX family protein n=1 Tax=Myxosarcina sp. GI1 TaxID=1541065 RepID=UPI0009077003|nr:DoxX family protein [Myxosarcina sp. GI1]
MKTVSTEVSNDKKSLRRELYATENYLPLLARISLSALFIWSGINKILHPIITQQYMSAHGMPLTSIFLIAAIALELLGACSLLLGIKPRWGATLLIIFLVPATLIFHTNFSTELQQAMFLKNLAMLGGLLMVIQYGGGNIALTK